MKKIFTLCLVLCMSYLSMGATNLKHEFRATWLTTAWGNDWPKIKVTNDATRKQQQDSLIAIFDRLQAGNMNAVCLQVRGRSDAFYQSSYEPWAAELAGARGTDPGYDPLAFAIEEAHKRGLELHAWVNPFRVTSAGTLASTDLVKKNAGQWIIQYNNGSFTGEIIDPGYPEAREYVLNVLMEIINNYDIDGIVMDDYFYPYGGTTTEDAASKALHKPANVVDVNQDGDTDDDWRRSNVDVFLEELYDRIQTKKPWVRFGMGTFGIWTTQSKVAQAYGISLPSGISGLDDYDEQACNPVEWVKNGYVDYINPQLYWPTTSTGQNYNKLCQWWAKDVCEHFSNQLTNGKKVHFFSSQSISSNSAVSEIQAEIDANRNNLSSGSTGSVFFDTDAYLTMDKDLMTSRFATNALTPPMDWKSNTALAAPTNLTVSGSTLTWQHATAERFTVYVYPKGTAWSTAKNDPAYLQGVIYGKSMDISGIDTNANDIAVCAYDRFGVEHETAIYGATPGDVTPPASGTITYELNGGVQSSYLTAQDMYADLNVDYNAATGATAAWLSLAECTATNQGIPTAVASMDVTFFTAAGAEKWGWLVTYVDKVSADQAVAVASSSSASMRYNLQSFFKNWQHTGWPKSADYTTCGVSTLEAYQPYWKSSFANPTEPTAEVTLYAPYKEGATFDGWYAAADFSGEKVTKIDANTTGTLYAKWAEYIPTIAEVKALADDVVTNVSGVVNHIQGKNVYIQDATGGILVYTSEYPTCKVGDKIVAKGVKAIYGGAPEVKNAVINTTEASTLAQSQTFEGLSELVADMKHFATRVTVPGLKIVSYDGYNIPTVTDGVNEALCYRMPLDPAQFPIGSKITITAVAGWYNGFQFVGDVAGIELVVVGKKDKYEYPVRNSEEHSYTLINDWVISNNEDNFAANAPGKTDHVRGMAVKDGIMYFINRDTKSIVPVVGTTAEMLDPIAITGEHLFERIGENGEWESACTLPFNDIEFDQSGNCLIGSCVSGDGTFQIYEVDLETGAATLVVEERLYDNPDFLNNGYRFDAFSVAGDVTQNGVIMAADGTSGSWNVYRWLITDGEVAPAEQITMLLDPEYDQSLFINAAGWGTGPQIFPQDEIGSLFYVDGFNMLPMLFDEGGMLVDDFINCPTQKEVTNKDGDVLMMNTGHNGLVEFQVGDEYFLLMAAGNTAAAVPSSFALFKFADEGRTFDGLEPLWYFPANGMGTSTNGCRTAVPSVEVVDDKTANLYLYTNNNGYARYTLNIGETTAEVIDPTWQITYTSTYGKIVTPYATDVFGANIVSNTYKDGVGTITFDGPVTSIGDSAFYECFSLTSITIPNSVTSIGNGAFHGCQRLTYITIPNSVRSIENAFYCCYSLTSVTIPKSVTSIESRAFELCKALTSIVVDSGNTTYDSRDNCNAIIETATNTLVVGCKNTIIPESVTSIGSEAFYNCFSLTSITIPNSVTSIGSEAFYNCDGLTSITIPNSVTSIGKRAFSDCDGLTSVTIPESVTSIGDYAFGSSNLTSIVVESGNTTYDSRDNCHALIETATNTLIVGCKNTIIPESVTSIGGYAFSTGSLTSITIPNNVTSIGEGAFRYCYYLTSITIPNSVTSIRAGTFCYCYSLTSITIPNSVTSIRTGAFSYCYGLTSVIIPNSVTSIGKHAFSYCSSLDTIYVEATTPPTLEDSTVFMDTPSPICVIPCGTLAAYEASGWAQYVSEFVEEGCPKITYELNGGVTNDYGWMSKDDMYHDLLVDINAIIPTTSVDVDTVTLAYDKTKNIQEGIPTYWYDLSSLLTHSDFLSKWGWLINYMDSACAPESKYLPSTFSVYLRYNLSAFFFEKEYTSWPQTPDYSKYGLYPYYQPAWQHAFDNPTNPAEEFVLNAPYKEGYTFAGWYTNADFSGEKVTTINAETEGTLYAKWINNDWIITYTSTDGNIVTPYKTNVFGANIVSNTYENGVGTITFDGPVTSIGECAFERCNSLFSIIIPNNVISIGIRSFADCLSLNSLVIEKGNTVYDSRNNCNAIIETATNTLIAGCKNTIIPNSVTSIGNYAFERCGSLVSIIIPNSVTSIGGIAFFGCSSLNSITIPNSVRSIGGAAFNFCPILTSIVVEEGNSVYDCRENCNAIIETATNTLIAGCQNTIIPNSVTSIGSEAFCGCSSLTSITIPNSVTSIGYGAFLSSRLTSVTIPNNVTSIGGYAFYGSHLDTIYVETTTPPMLGNDVFTESPASLCYIPCGTLAVYEASDWASQVGSFVEECVEGQQITYTSTNDSIVTPYDVNAFDANIVSNVYENGVGTITFDGPVTTIGYYAFHNCDSLISIIIPNSVKNIGYGVFSGCVSLESITIGSGVTTIGEDVFGGCGMLTSIEVDANNVTFDSREDCNAIIKTANNILVAGCKTTVIPSSIKGIGNNAFAGNWGLTSIEIPDGVETIGSSAFGGCTVLRSVMLPNSLVTIGDDAFSTCPALTSITIPSSVKRIGADAFWCDYALDTLYVEATIPPTLGYNPFYNAPVSHCFIPCGTLSAYEASDWASQVGRFEEDCVEGQQIFYTSTDGNIVTPYATDVFGANIVSNEYKDGQGVITFDGPVTSIGDSAFYQCKSLASITIPNSVTSIGKRAFHSCYSLTSVTIPNSVTSIGNDAFYDCDGLISITIPNSVTSIGGFAFGACSSITSITIPNSVVSIKNSAFAYCSSLISISIPSSVTSIGERICEGCSSLISIVVEESNKIYDSRMNCNAIIETATNTLVAGCQNTIIPHSVMSIGDAAFSECSSLNSIIIPNSVTTLGCSAFYGCVSLTSIGIPSSITKIGVSAFSGCYYLDTIYVEAINPPSLGAYIFYGNPSPVCVIPCGTLAAYEASDWASQVGSFVEDCVEGQQIYYTSTDGNIVTPYKTNVFGANIVSNEYKDGQGVITFDGPVTSIGDYAFYECSALTSITIPSSVKSIGYLAFVNCSSLPFVTIPNSVTSIGDYAFHGCDSLTYITIPNSVTSIGKGAFGGCSSLTSMVVESGNANYDSRENCNAIIETTTNTLIAGCQNTIIPNSVTSIATHAFSGRSSLISITIPKSVVSIGSSAFWGCSSLTSITIPNSVESIGNHAFVDCSSLDTIYVEAATPPTLGENVFYGTPSPICVIPCGTLAAYEASDWANYMGEFVEEGCASIQMCGDDLHWEYADGVLTITGTGEMYDYAADTDVPWYDVRGNIKTVSLPDAMTKIGQNAFYKCTAMTSINMPTSLTAIGEKAFAQDTKLACEIILPASMTNIATRAFFNCQAVTAFHIEATTPPTIQADAFDYTTAPIHVPCGYGHIYGKHAQWGVLNLEMCEVLQDNVYYYPIDGHTARAVTYHSNPTDTIVLPSAVVIDGMPRTVTEVAASAFADCKDIPAIIFNEGLEYIGERAFVRCYGLQGTIVLPATLETIGERAFSYCDNVEKYLIQAMTPPALGDGAFTCANHDALFYVSCEAMDDYKVATNWSSLKSRLRDACLNIYHYNTALGANGVYTTEDTLVASIYYRRQFTPYRWETLYLPFEVDRVTVLEDGEEFDLRPWNIITGGDYYLAKPDGMLNLEILFDFTDELEAHTPYIIQFVYDYYRDKIITFYGKESWNKLSTSFEVLSSSAWMQIAGNTTMQDQLLEKPVYMLRSGLDFILQKTTTTLHPFECYVMPYATSSGTPARMNVRMRDDVATAVESVKGNESHLTYTVDGYTLTVYPQGQAFSIYSLNGALIYSCEAGKEAVDCELNSGCYLLHAGAEAHKIML